MKLSEDKFLTLTIKSYPNLTWATAMLIASIIIYSAVRSHLALLVVWVLWFAIFDFIGFRISISKLSFRFLQTSFQIALTGLVWLLADRRVALAANIIWITLGCDMIYIWILKADPFDWDYFKISPINFFYQVILRRNTPWIATLISAGVGLIIALIIIWS